MNFGNLLFGQPDNIKKSLRNIESIEKKLANTRIATVFNQTCLNEYLLPTFTNIYIYIYLYIYIVCFTRCMSCTSRCPQLTTPVNFCK